MTLKIDTRKMKTIRLNKNGKVRQPYVRKARHTGENPRKPST